ncbi:MAG: PDDEXK nuclease domain-containing protein, partial [Muribaculaceae bacterium]|nr:PDDEXK nuclease domain-containing protein [Muribaculaceae bacterium]
MAKETTIRQHSADYNVAVQTIKDAILRSQYQAAKLINREMLSLYYGIGRYISANSREGFWGTGAIRTISERLRKELPGLKGFSETNLKNMRLFYEEWEPVFNKSVISTLISSIATDEIETSLLLPVKSSVTTDDLESFLSLDFTHHIAILNGEKDASKRLKYIQLSLANRWNTKYLQQQIKDNAADKYGAMPSSFGVTIKDSRDAIKALNMFKDEYLLDFINTEEIGIRDIQDIDERVVEKEIIHNIKKFIMTFGRDFAFVGNQYHLEAFSEDFFPDLLFFNRELNCLVVVELKTGNFKPGYLGQLMTYLRILDDKVKKPHENPSIGIVLCKEANRSFVEYVMQDYDKPMGVATYTTTKEMPEMLKDTLPDMDELKKLL